MNLSTRVALDSLLSLLISSAQAVDGTIEFNGAIMTDTCTIDTTDGVVNVELGSYAANQFQYPGDKSPTIPFSIPLKNCPTTAWKHIDGTTDASFQIWLQAAETVGENNDMVKPASMDTAATGVGIKIETANGTPLALNKLTTPAVKFPITAGSMNLDLAAYYKSLVEASDITAGEADGVVDITFDYR
ncbi:fimbrial protein [Franconibacter daqui]|uniref:fimbrial protein n=1 Tax=Franconibacter daqui TaxID=2047724 RepID=UPI0030D2888B